MRLTRRQFSRYLSLPLFAALAFFACSVEAGGQIYSPLSASVRTAMQRNVSDQSPQRLAFSSQQEADFWLSEMSRRLQSKFPDAAYRMKFLHTVHYEATRAGLEPELVLGLIEVESGFRKYATSRVGARGYMQVMPFWVSEIGMKGQNLFQMHINLRYGCTILRHYLDIEKGDLYRALGRYNGTLGKSKYPNLVRAAWHNHWTLPRRTVSNNLTPNS